MLASSRFYVPELGGRHGVKKLKRELDKIPGVTSVAVNEATGQVAVDYDDTATGEQEIRQIIADMGFSTQPLSR